MTFELLKDLPGLPAGTEFDLDLTNPYNPIYTNAVTSHWFDRRVVELDKDLFRIARSKIGDSALKDGEYLYINDKAEVTLEREEGKPEDAARQAVGNYYLTRLKAAVIRARVANAYLS